MLKQSLSLSGIILFLFASVSWGASATVCGGLNFPKAAHQSCLKSRLPIDALYACAKSFSSNDVIATCVEGMQPTDVIYTCAQVHGADLQKKCLAGTKTSEQIVKCLLSSHDKKRLDSCISNTAGKSPAPTAPDGQH